jgi:hypothetical protein
LVADNNTPIASSPSPDIREQAEVKRAEEIKAMKIHPKIKEEPVTPVRLPRSSFANDEVTKNDSPSRTKDQGRRGVREGTPHLVHLYLASLDSFLNSTDLHNVSRWTLTRGQPYPTSPEFQ